MIEKTTVSSEDWKNLRCRYYRLWPLALMLFILFGIYFDWFLWAFQWI